MALLLLQGPAVSGQHSWPFGVYAFVFFFLVVLGIELRPSHRLGRHSTIELYPQPIILF